MNNTKIIPSVTVLATAKVKKTGLGHHAIGLALPPAIAGKSKGGFISFFLFKFFALFFIFYFILFFIILVVRISIK